MKVNNPETLADVMACIQCYENAVAANDVATLNELFWSDALALRYGYKENLYGYRAISEYRNTRTPASEAKRIATSVITSFGSHFATANIDFVRAHRRGRQSQTWVRMPEGWRIVAAHVSYLETNTITEEP